jgi:hypothetical protein
MRESTSMRMLLLAASFAAAMFLSPVAAKSSGDGAAL